VAGLTDASTWRTRLIAFEGLNGVGKSTLVSLVAEQLMLPYVTTVPSDAAEARRLFDDAPFSMAAFLFYLSWSKRLSDQLRSGVHGPWLLCDRYVASTLSYCGAAGLETRPVVDQVEIALPALTVLVVADEAVRRRRLGGRGQLRPLELATYALRFRAAVIDRIRQYRPLMEVDNSRRTPTSAAAEVAMRISDLVNGSEPAVG
jgi:thymidylate kinase